jgi:ABC-type uncharacterized transport system involved in gliding motility auxiliary subunit
VKSTLQNLNPTLVNSLFWLGIGVMVAGLSAGVVSGVWSAIPIGLVSGGLVLTVIWLVLRWQMAPPSAGGWWRLRSFQAGTNAVLTTVAVVVILAGVNFLAARTPAQIDFTEARLFSVAPQTRQIMKQLKQPVKVMVFSAEAASQQRSLLEQYQRINSERFKFEFIDPQAQPLLTQKYKITTSGEVVLEVGTKTKTVGSTLTESSLTSALATLTQDKKVNIAVVQGHGEAAFTGDTPEGLSLAIEELKKREINVTELNFAQQKSIPADTNVLIIAGPKRPFEAAELKQLESFLKSGKSLLLMVDAGFKTGLEPLLKNWGVTLDNRLVLDASGTGQQFGLGPAVPLVTQYGEHPITKDFAKGRSFFPLAQAVTVKPPSGDTQSTDLMQTSDQSWAEADADNQTEVQFNPNRDRQGPLTIGVALTQKVQSTSPSPAASKPDSAPPPTAAKMVVIGDTDFATNGAFGKALNGDVFLNSVTWLGSGQDDPTLSIRPKEQTERRVELNPMQWRSLVLASLGLPGIAFLGAAYLWWQRR